MLERLRVDSGTSPIARAERPADTGGVAGITPEVRALDRAFINDWAGRYLRAWNAHDPGAVASLCTEDIVWSDPSLAQPAQGRAGVSDFVRATSRAFPDFHVEESEPPLLAAGKPRALSRYRITATMLGDWEASNLVATGARMSIAGVDEWHFRGELLCRYGSYYDSLDLARQLGILPAAGSTAERALARVQHLQARLRRRRAEGR